jgi:hypothetical protein
MSTAIFKPAMDDATKSMFEDMVKKLVMDMMSDKAASSETESPPVKAESPKKPTIRKIPNELKSS